MPMESQVYFPNIDLATIEELLQLWHSAFPGMGIFALFPENEKLAIKGLQNLCVRQNIPLCGAIFPQLIYGATFHDSGMCLLRFDIMPYAVLFTDIRPDLAGAVEIAETISQDIEIHLDDETPATLFLTLDGLLPNISSILDELYLRLANRVQYAGVNAGSETFQALPCLFDNNHVVGDGVLAILMKPHRGAILEHGYRTGQDSLPATSTDSNRIIQINWRPTFEVYQELVQANFGVAITRDNFYQYAVHFPFGILRANHSIVVRIPVMLDDDNALYCIGEVPAHSMLTLLKAPQVDSASTLETLQQGLTQLSGSPTNKAILLFYCAGRRLHLGPGKAIEELQLFNRLTQAATIAGGLALGEIGDTTLWGYPLFHNATLVTTLWPNSYET